MNNFERLVYGPREAVRSKAEGAEIGSHDCCDAYCASIKIAEDYITTLQKEVTELSLFREKAFEAHPNIDLDISALNKE